MFIDIAMGAARSEDRRQMLLAEADHYRLAALARAGRRAARRAAEQGLHRIGEPAGRDPAPPPGTGPAGAPQVTTAAAGKADANCR